MPTFSGHVQYNDWRGTAAADDADMGALRVYLVQQGLMSDNEFLVGFEIYSGASSPAQPAYFSARVFLVEAGHFEGAVQKAIAQDPVEVKSVTVDLGLEEFFKLFKRFDVVMTHRGLDLGGREYREKE